MSKEKKNKPIVEPKVISSNPNTKKRMVVVQTTIPNKKNRKGQPFKTSVTKHQVYKRLEWS